MWYNEWGSNEVFYIRKKDEPKLVWAGGWREKDPTIFNDEHTLKFPLPPCGEWVELTPHLLEAPDAG